MIVFWVCDHTFHFYRIAPYCFTRTKVSRGYKKYLHGNCIASLNLRFRQAFCYNIIVCETIRAETFTSKNYLGRVSRKTKTKNPIRKTVWRAKFLIGCSDPNGTPSGYVLALGQSNFASGYSKTPMAVTPRVIFLTIGLFSLVGNKYQIFGFFGDF